jgi:hypothetical protein
MRESFFRLPILPTNDQRIIAISIRVKSDSHALFRCARDVVSV